MKVRLRANTIRLRLTQEEVSAISGGEPVKLCTSFGAGFRQQLVWMVSAHHVGSSNTTILFDGSQVAIELSGEHVSNWLSDGTVEGFTETVASDAEESIILTVQRDYACLVPRDPAEDAGAFPHPGGGECC